MRLQDKRVVILLEQSFEDLEFWVPTMRLQEEGASVTIAAPEAGHTYVGKQGVSATSEVKASTLRPDDFDAVVVPGGWAPDKLRRYDGVLSLVRGLYEQEKIVAQICHAGLVGISAGIVDGHRATGSLGIKDDLVNAGATWVDEAAFTDGPLVWGRVVKDIPDFCRELVQALETQ
ncbi:MAG: type 1 glutamine amidotransferase [Spiribacter salinus]|uniref:Type 1 glutamine amidotransferase n=1 Tax=Spiribacter salinus TaxID=1335746 RepID=A0A540VPS8_9GAMM|nr:MAG: type 1 glutamine amidotransferase [Spiribacter salinus]